MIDQDSFGMKNTLFTILSTNNSTTQESRIINERIETKANERGEILELPITGSSYGCQRGTYR